MKIITTMMFASGEFKWLWCTFRRVRFICNDIVNKFVRALFLWVVRGAEETRRLLIGMHYAR